MKILIAIPTPREVEPECLKSIYGLDKCGHEVLLDITYGYEIDAERNCIAQNAIDGGYDYVLMVDSDVVLPSDALRNLLDPQTDIVLGQYRERRRINNTEKKCTCLNRFGKDRNFNDEDAISVEEFNSMREQGLNRIEIHGGGCGCILISTNALKQMEKPWFNFITYPDGSCLSEDLYFCLEAQRFGFKVYADTRVQCGHILKQTYWC